MPTETTTTQEELQTVEVPNAFDDSNWSDAPPEITGTPAAAEPAKVEAPEPTKIPAVDYNQYVKEKFGFDSEEVALAEIAKLKEKPETKFANEQSEKLFKYLQEGKEDDVLNLLSQKKKYDRLSTAEVNNVDIAADIVKAAMQAKYKDLTADEVEYKFNKTFSIPAAPKQKDDELDEEFEERLNDWKFKKEEAEKDLIIEAKLVKPEIEKLKTELVLPDLKSPAAETNIQSSEEAARMEKMHKDYEASIDNTVKAFGNIEVKAKVGEDELPISYVVTEQDKAELSSHLRDADYIPKRWFDEQGVPKSQAIAEDIFWLQNKSAVIQKVANDAAAKALENYIKNRSNIKLNGEQQQTFVPNDKSPEQLQADAIWDA